MYNFLGNVSGFVFLAPICLIVILFIWIEDLEYIKYLKWISRQIDKLRGGNELTQWGSHYSKWYVQYNENEKSVTMLYSTAKDYAVIFGGEVKHVNDGCDTPL